jgi:hypothetical protein
MSTTQLELGADKSVLSAEQAASRDSALVRFQEMAAAKYEAGQKEHGGNLWEKPGLLDNMEEEVIDAWFYIQALKQQQNLLNEAVSGFLNDCMAVGIRDPLKFILSKQLKVYSYLKGAFPRGILPTDADGEIELNGEFLRLEHKYDYAIRNMSPENRALSGQTRSLYALVAGKGFTVVFVGENDQRHVTCVRVWKPDNGEVKEVWYPEGTEDTLRAVCGAWASKADPGFNPRFLHHVA